MMALSHYQFQRRLIEKSKQFPWCKIVLTDEAYTSQTCGRCGELNKSLGSSAVFKCPDCRNEVDRDTHAARNILLRNLTKNCRVSRLPE